MLIDKFYKISCKLMILYKMYFLWFYNLFIHLIFIVTNGIIGSREKTSTDSVSHENEWARSRQGLLYKDISKFESAKKSGEKTDYMSFWPSEVSYVRTGLYQPPVFIGCAKGKNLVLQEAADTIDADLSSSSFCRKRKKIVLCSGVTAKKLNVNSVSAESVVKPSSALPSGSTSSVVACSLDVSTTPRTEKEKILDRVKSRMKITRIPRKMKKLSIRAQCRKILKL